MPAKGSRAYAMPVYLPLREFASGNKIEISGQVFESADSFTVMLTDGTEMSEIALKIYVDFVSYCVKVSGKGGSEQHFDDFPIYPGSHFEMTIRAAGDKFTIEMDCDWNDHCDLTFPFIAADVSKIKKLKIGGDLKNPVNVEVTQ